LNGDAGLVGDLLEALAAIACPSPGGFAWLPRGDSHSFRVDSDDAHFLEFATPGGVEGFHVDASEAAPVADLPPASQPDVGPPMS
jgi:hypothetical protein